jgi:fatty-acyl-CoA synthase
MPSLSDALRTTASRNPDRVALICGDRSRTYAEFHAEVERMAAVIASRGVTPGERLLLMSGNSDYFAIAAYAVLRTGAILVPANPRSAPPEISYLLDDSGAVMLITSSELVELADAGASAAASPARDVVGLGTTNGHDDLLELATSTTLPPLEFWPNERDDSLIIYTSGTTGKPKGALFDHTQTTWVGINMATVCGVHEMEQILHVAPLYHAAELCMLLFPGTMLAATHVILPAFDPTAVVQAMADHRISIFFGVPTMYQFLLQVPALATLDLSNWRVGMFGAAPMPSSVVTRLIDALPNVDLFQLCGQTEGGPGGIYSGPADVRDRPDASGRYSLPNTECRIVNESNEDVEAGQVGELLLRSDTVMKRYWNKPEETAKTIVNGWLHTGDLALLDADGYMTLVDRLKDMIITGGRNVYSVEVESALMGHPDIVDVAVLGVPNEEFGESILAVIVAREGTEPSLESVKSYALTQISNYKVPHQLVLHSIPRNPSGKIQKHVLRAALVADSVLAG